MTLPYDTYKDLTPIMHFFDVAILLAASIDSPYKTMADMLAAARANGPPIPYASASGGSMQHLWAELLKMQLGLRLESVGYKGSSEAVRDVMGGHVPLLVDLLVPTGAAVKSGKLRGLAVALPERAPLLPDVPTVREAGLTNMDGAVFNGFMAPAGTPAEIVARLNKAMNEALAEPAFHQRLVDMGFHVIGGTPEKFAATLASETTRWRGVIRQAHIPPPA